MRALLTLLIIFSSGCTALKSTYQMIDTERAWRDAVQAGAEDDAAYAYTLAKLYRDKAWEEWGYADYQAAEELAREASQYCLDAKQTARFGGSDEPDLAPGGLPELPEEEGEW